MTAASRRRGHDCEREVARWLRSHGFPDARTTRAALGHDGAHAPGDVIGPVGLVIEVKDVAASAWPTWCRQAEDEANGRPWVVVRRERGNRDVGSWPCRYVDHPAALVVGRATFAAFLAGYADDAAHVCSLCGLLLAPGDEHTDSTGDDVCLDCCDGCAP